MSHCIDDKPRLPPEELLEARIRVLEAQVMNLEAENAQLRDSIMEATRRLQEVVTWNEWDVPKRVDPDREEA